MRYYLFLCFFISWVHVAAANKEEPPRQVVPYKAVISFVPQYALLGGLRMDGDFRINTNHWIQLAPIFFISDSTRVMSEGNRLRGIGLHMNHRYYPGEGFSKVPVYFSYGLVYHRSRLSFHERTDGILQNRFSHIQKLGLDVTIGLYSIIGESFFIDFYTGMGIRHSFHKTNAQRQVKHDTSFFDYGYSGNILLLGCRFGIPVK